MKIYDFEPLGASMYDEYYTSKYFFINTGDCPMMKKKPAKLRRK